MDTVQSIAVSSMNDIELSNVSYDKSENSGSSHFHASHSFIKSDVPFNADNSGRSRACLVLGAHNSHKQTERHPTSERTQEQENQLNDSSTTSDEHILIQSHNGFLMPSVIKLTDAHYRELAELINFVCHDLATSIPDYSDKFNEIKQMVESTIQIYNNQNGELEQANKDVRLQYKELTRMLDGLPLPQPPLNIDIDGILKDMQFQEYVGPYSPDKLKKAIKRINIPTASRSRPRPTASSQLKCSIQ